MLRHLHHQVWLRHSDLQCRFVLALGVAAAVGLSVLRAELPSWASAGLVPPLLWAFFEMRSIRELVGREDKEALAFRVALGEVEAPEPKDSWRRGGDGP